MKKLLYSAAAMVLAFFAASCQQENLEPVVGANTVTYTVQVPESIQTKALGDEVTAVNKVYYQVYRAAEVADLAKTYVYDGYADVNAGQASFELEFVKNQEFVVLFWAQNSALQMFDLDDLRVVELATPGNSNNANAQVFAGKDEVDNCVSAVGGNVELVRPISQLNIYTTKESLTWGTGITLEKSYVKVSGLYKAYNVAEGAAVLTAETETYEYALANVPATADTDQYAYVAMNYVGFADEDNTVVDVEFSIETSEKNHITHSVGNVPVKPNYRTNIVGNLLTAETEYNVTLNDTWYTPSEVVEIWDGQTLATPDYNVENKTWTVDNGAELAWIAHLVNGTLPADAPTTKSGDSTPKYDKSQVIVLNKNINLGGYEWTPIGTGSKHFQGLFEGNGHIIENFQITEKHNGGSQAAFFGTVSGDPTFRNVTIQNAKVVYPGEEVGDFYAAALIGTAYGNVTVQNVTVKNCEISGNNKVAGILAHDGVMSSLNIDNCHVLNCEIVSAHATDGGNVGGLVGLFQGVAKTASNAAPYGDHIIKNSSVKNTVINAVNSTNSGKRSNGEFVACIAGKANQTLVINNCEVEGNTFTQNEGVTYVSPYGVFVGGDRLDDRKATVIVDGKMMIDNGFTKEGNTFEVSNAAHFLAAANMLADGDVIKLLANVTFNENNRTNNGGWWDGLAYSGDKSFTIDLGGHTISQDGALNDYLVWIKNVGSKENTITFKNGTMDAGKTAFCALCTASSHENKLTVNLENITLINENSNGSTVKIRAGSELNVKAGTKITGRNSYLGVENWNAVVNIYGGAEIYMNGTTSYNGCLVGVGGNGTVNVYGGYGKGVSGGLIAMTSGGTINAMGGEWIANTDGTFANSNKSVLVAQSDKQYNAGAGNAVVNVTGGTYKGGYNCYGNAVGDAQINISGGNFNADPSAYLEDACEATVNAGVWTVRVLPAAKIGETEYASLQEAFNVGGNITLLRDVATAETVVLAEGMTVVLDLNGKTLSAADKNTLRNDGGNLTIKNGTVTRTGDIVGYSVNNASGEISVENATIARGLYTSGSKLTANNANISHEQSSRHAIYSWNCEVTINSGTFHNDNAGNATLMASGSSVVTINGGTFSIADGRSTLGWTSCMIDQNGTAQVTVKGGLFNGGFRINSADTILSIEGGEFNTNNGSAYTDYSGTKVVKGGKFTDAGAQNWAKKYIADGYEMNTDGEVVAK